MYVSSFVLRGIADRLRSAGVGTDELLRGTGIDAELLRDPSARMPIDAAGRYISRAMELTGDPGLGLTIAADPPAGAQTVIYHLVLACNTVREGITRFQRIARLVVEDVQFELIEQGDVARFVYRSPLSLGDVSRFAADLALTFAHRLATHFYREVGERPLQVVFRHARPSYADRYAALFGCPASFGARHSEIVFRREFLDRESFGNEPLKQSMEETACKVLSSRPQDDRMSERIRLLLRFQTGLELVTTESLARRLALSERSLRRRLRSEGVSLTQIIDGVRREIACEELGRPQACIESTARRVGFTDRTAFHRAFKRWTGQTPQEYRTRSAI